MAVRAFSGNGPFSTHTRLACSFHSDDGFDGDIGVGQQTFGYVVAGSYAKGFGDAAGPFSLKLKLKPGVESILSRYPDPEDVWVKIKCVLNGEVYDLCLGLTDSIVENTTRNRDGSESVVYDITGRDFGKCLEHLELFVNFWPVGGPPVPQFASYSAEAAQRMLPLGSPDVVIRGLLDIWLGNNGTAEKQWLLPSSLHGPTGARYIYDLLNLGNISTGLRGQLANDPTLLSPDPLMNRSLWDVLQEYSHSLLNEMWVDLAPDPDLPNGARRLDALRPSFFLRERPFQTIKSTRRWEALRTLELTAHDVGPSRRIVSGDGGASRFNWWELIPNGISANPIETQALMQQGDGRPGGMPIYNLDSIRKHGLRRYSQQSKYLALPAGPNGDTSFISYAQRWVRIVHDWYAVAPLQHTGTLELTRLRPDARMGMKVRETRADGTVWTYYLEHVAHTFETDPEGRQSGRTTLTLTHGQPEEAHLLDRVYAYYRGVDLSSLSDEEVQQSTPTAEAAGTSTTADDAPTATSDPDVPLPPDEGTVGETGLGGGGGVVDTVTSSDGGAVPLDATTDAADGEMVSPPEDVEDTDITPDELEAGSAADGPDVIQLETVTITARGSRSAATRRGRTSATRADSTTSVGSGPDVPSPTSTRGSGR